MSKKYPLYIYYKLVALPENVITQMNDISKALEAQTFWKWIHKCLHFILGFISAAVVIFSGILIVFEFGSTWPIVFLLEVIFKHIFDSTYLQVLNSNVMLLKHQIVEHKYNLINMLNYSKRGLPFKGPVTIISIITFINWFCTICSRLEGMIYESQRNINGNPLFEICRNRLQNLEAILFFIPKHYFSSR